MQKLRHESILRRLQKEGFSFSAFTLQSEGNYAADDADWNYKDVPHLSVVHERAEACPVLIGDDMISNIIIQKIFGFWFPLTIVIYEAQKNYVIYYTTLFFFALIIETRIEELAENRTRVSTTYNIGYPRWLFFTLPLLRWAIKNNYATLMKEDIPMRERRGALRKLGYRFLKKRDTHSFLDTVNIYEKNVLPPAGASLKYSADYENALGGHSECTLGDQGLLGIRLVVEGDKVSVWPRACPHEGAPLDQAACKGGMISCPWHGRRIAAIGSFTRGQSAELSNDDYAIQVSGRTISWEYRGADTSKTEAQVA